MPSLKDLQEDLWTWVVGDGLSEVLVTILAAVTLYLVALWATRTGKKRFLGRNTVFDVLLAFILGSVFARAINGDAPLLSTVVAGFVLVGMHWLFGTIAARTSRGFGRLVKGQMDAVVKDGEVDWEAMRQHHLTQNDLEEAARQNGLDSVEQIHRAHFERNGKISITAKPSLHVVEVDVAEGVQTVRLELRE